MGGLLIVDENKRRALALAGRLRDEGFSTLLGEPGHGPEGGSSECDVDLALLQLGTQAGNAVSRAQDLLARDAATEVIFFAEHECPEVAIARSLGITRIASAEVIQDWLVENATSLVRFVRTRRSFLEAQRHLPELPAYRPPPRAPSVPRLVPLPVAEQRFRESFLRQLLADAPNREVAARIAGVPYRTLCDMLKRLGISSPARPRRA